MSDYTDAEKRIIDAQLEGWLPSFFTSREAVQMWRRMNAIAEGRPFPFEPWEEPPDHGPLPIP